MKKIAKILSLSILAAALFVGCSNPADPDATDTSDTTVTNTDNGSTDNKDTGANKEEEKKEDKKEDDKEESAKEVVLLNEEFTMAWSGRQFEVSNVPYGVKIVVHLKSKKESDNAIFRMAPTWAEADAFTKGTFDPEVWYFGTDGAISAPGFSDVNVVYFPSNAEVDALNTSKTLIIQGPGTAEGEETIIDSIKLVPPTKA